MGKTKKIILVSGPVIIEKGKVLLNKDYKDNLWKFCGGIVNLGKEALEETAKREVREEMGIKIKIIQALKPMIIKKDKDTWVVLFHYLAKRLGRIKAGKGIKVWSWFPINKLPKNCAPNIKPILKSLKK